MSICLFYRKKKGVIKKEEGINNVKAAKYMNTLSMISEPLAAIFFLLLFLNYLLAMVQGRREEKPRLWDRIFFVSEQIQI